VNAFSLLLWAFAPKNPLLRKTAFAATAAHLMSDAFSLP
jgi:hypothetical protein